MNFNTFTHCSEKIIFKSELILHFFTFTHCCGKVFFFVSESDLHFYTFTHCSEKKISVRIFFRTSTHCSEKVIFSSERILRSYTFTHCSGIFFFCRNLICTFTLVDTGSKKYFSVQIYFYFYHCLEKIFSSKSVLNSHTLHRKKIQFEFIFHFCTFTHRTGKVFFCLNLFCTSTHLSEKLFFFSNLFSTFTHWKSIFLAESVLHFYTFTHCSEFFFLEIILRSEFMLHFYTFTHCSRKVFFLAVCISAKYKKTEKYWLKKIVSGLNLFCTFAHYDE